MKLTLEEVLAGIEPADTKWQLKARHRLADLAIPQGSLGELLSLAEQLAAIKKTLKPSVKTKVVVTMAGDHGVVAEGVSNCPQEVTPQMVVNFVRKGAAINALAKVAGARVLVVDMGVNADLGEFVQRGQILSKKVGYGTQNMTLGPAMSSQQALKAVEAGIHVVKELVENCGVELLATGDMGIGNTTASSAILAALAGCALADVTGRGTGLDDAALTHKIKVIHKALAVNDPDPGDALDVLAKVGGFEIGGIAGLVLGAAYYKVPVVVDGFISSAGALLAKAMAPDATAYMIASHLSAEPGHRFMLQELGLKPLLNLNLRLGEGTGATLAMGIVESAAQVMQEVLTFAEAGVSEHGVRAYD